MARAANSLVGGINFVTFLISIVILGGGIWLSTRANSDCLKFLQWPIIIIGVALMVISLAGFAGACYHIPWILKLYLFAMFFVIVTLIGFTIFAFAVTDKGEGKQVPGRAFLEYDLSDYSGWLRDRVANPSYWKNIRSCLEDTKTCRRIGRYFVVGSTPRTVMPEPAEVFYLRKLSPIESGCCKPPTECGFGYVNETVWSGGAAVVAAADVDCGRWSNEQGELCYECDSCRASVLATLKRSWRKVAIINVVVIVLLVIVYVMACFAIRNSRRIDGGEGFGEARMTKSGPSRFQF